MPNDCIVLGAPQFILVDDLILARDVNTNVLPDGLIVKLQLKKSSDSDLSYVDITDNIMKSDILRINLPEESTSYTLRWRIIGEV